MPRLDLVASQQSMRESDQKFHKRSWSVAPFCRLKAFPTFPGESLGATRLHTSNDT